MTRSGHEAYGSEEEGGVVEVGRSVVVGPTVVVDLAVVVVVARGLVVDDGPGVVPRTTVVEVVAIGPVVVAVALDLTAGKAGLPSTRELVLGCPLDCWGDDGGSDWLVSETFPAVVETRHEGTPQEEPLPTI
jgi:hypothetical protein